MIKLKHMQIGALALAVSAGAPALAQDEAPLSPEGSSFILSGGMGVSSIIVEFQAGGVIYIMQSTDAPPVGFNSQIYETSWEMDADGSVTVHGLLLGDLSQPITTYCHEWPRLTAGTTLAFTDLCWVPDDPEAEYYGKYDTATYQQD
ncbi:hypothetical protein [Maricaulis parjimensis]|uniref:hypothetical protein n=1 Tax=Maricaulis parjimensis TaxID=144023 RepID=UPI00193ABB79|nr:hypothetical protein [Maricaulis parjimensis]